MIVALALSFAASAGENEHLREPTSAAGRTILVILEEEELSSHAGGGGLALETPLGHHLAIELTGGALFGPDGTKVPLEIIGERIFAAGHRIEPYVGLGPLLLLSPKPPESEPKTQWGGVAALGTHVWFGDIGLQLEIDATACGSTHGPTIGGELLSGVAWRWR